MRTFDDPTRLTKRTQRWVTSIVTAVAALAGTSCGAPAPTDSNTEALQQGISGGYVDERTSGVVGLGIYERGHFFAGHCSGTLIAPNLVLTARHCVTQMDPTNLDQSVQCGTTDFRETRPADTLLVSPETRRPLDPNDPSFIAGASIHPVPGADNLCGYDVALIVLERSFDPDDATPITPRVDGRTESFETFSASGYGLTGPDENSPSGLRMRIDKIRVSCSRSECAASYPSLITSTEWLAEDAGVCSGDSGGPALDDEGRVIGVASRGGGDCETAIYGDVAAWSEFIIEVAMQAADEGDYDAPFWTSGSSTPPPADEMPDVELDEERASLDSECDESADCASGPAAFNEETACSLSPVGARSVALQRSVALRRSVALQWAFGLILLGSFWVRRRVG